MATCPFCGAQNIEGVDACESCQEPLDFLSQPRPHSEMERSVLKDRVYMLNPRPPRVVAPDVSVSDVLAMLVERSIGCIIVVNGQEIAGIFTEQDALLRLNTAAADLADRPIRDFMTPSPATVDADSKIAFALSKMDLGGYRHLPVLTDGKISGVISIRDILRYIKDGLAVTS